MPVSTLETVSGYIRRVKCNENSVQATKYLQQGRNNVYFSSKSSKWLRFACRYACFEAENGVHYIRSIIAMKITFKRRNSSNRIEITPDFLQNRVNDCDFRAAARVSKLKTACTTFGV